MRLLFISLVVAASALYYASVNSTSTDTTEEPDADTPPDPDNMDVVQPDTIIGEVENMLAKITVPAKYSPIIDRAEKEYALPSGLLARVLYRESRFREDIITGAVRSSVGAIGIAQFMPDTAMQMGVDPLDPFSAIPGAARYLSQLKRTTGSWEEAVAAYNWGVGNVQRKGLAKAPKETRDYLAFVMGAPTA